jgi:hypothetical protein
MKRYYRTQHSISVLRPLIVQNSETLGASDRTNIELFYLIFGLYRNNSSVGNLAVRVAGVVAWLSLPSKNWRVVFQLKSLVTRMWHHVQDDVDRDTARLVC